MRSILIAFLITGIAVILIGCTIAIPSFDASKLNVDYKETKIYDVNGKEIMHYQATPGDPVKLNEIPKQLQNALVAVEDSRFYEHNGIDFKAIARAVYRDIITRSAAEGGSTLTQQLAKNVYLEQDKTLERKVKEIAYAAQIERNFSKEDILEMYFNKIFFGHGAYGIKAAAQVYFGKGDNMEELTLGQMALLAGLPNAPSAYDPYINKDLSIQRRNIVLRAMEHEGYITKEQLEAAEKEDYSFDTEYKLNNAVDNKYPYYMDYILQEAEEKLDIDPELILRGGVKVYTNLDPSVQGPLQTAYDNPANFPNDAPDGTPVQAASVVVDPKTGGIAAIVGGRDQGKHFFRGFNRASSGKVRPGSAFKPVVVYGPAIDTGEYTSTSKLNNKQGTSFNGYQPRNWNDKYSDTVSLKEALTWSLNVPAVSLLHDIGIDVGYEYATEKFGVPLNDEDRNKLGIALGDVEISPLDLARAYTAFANNGVRTEPHAITKVVASDGRVLYQDELQQTQAIKKETAQVMTKLMKNVVEAGTGTGARLSDRDVAGKTGSTEYGPNSNRDIWFAGYTTDYVMVTWMGFDQTDDQHFLTGSSGIPANLFSTVMSQVPIKSSPTFDLNVKEQPKKDDEKKDDDLKNSIINDLHATLNGDSVRLDWSPVKVEGIKYFIYRAEKQANGTAANSVSLKDVTTPGYTDKNLEKGKTYLYAVVVFRTEDGQELAKSNIAEVKVPGGVQEPTPPTAPTDGTQPGAGGQDGNQNGGQGEGQGTGGSGGTGTEGSGGMDGQGGTQDPQQPQNPTQPDQPTDGGLIPPVLQGTGTGDGGTTTQPSP
ncbi:MAG TPA: PBP1A family penicillin-binding protein [Bacilli bacterium]|nr:PBP1A family penicillin-binding protein [Bacilli bacterium]